MNSKFPPNKKLVCLAYFTIVCSMQKGGTEMRPMALRPRSSKTFFRLLLALGMLFVMWMLGLGNSERVLAAFPGTNGKIVYSTNVSGNEEILVMNPDGSSPTNITNNSSIDQYPSWCADGTKIAFDSNRDGDFEIFVMNADGTGVVQLTNNSSLDALPAWSPDCTEILFYSTRDGNDEIYIMNADGTAQTNLTNDSASDVHASFSPDGSEIAFESSRAGGNQVFTMNPDGTGVAQLTSSGENGGPDWSPDGLTIAFHSNRTGNFEIFTMNADGTSQAALTTNSFTDNSPAYSPDGTQLAFHSERPAASTVTDIYRINQDGSGEVNLTNTAQPDSSADWQPLTNIAFNPSTRFIQVGNNTTVDIDFNGATDLFGYQFEVNYDPSIVSASAEFINTFFDTTTYASIPSAGDAVCSAGVCTFAVSKLLPGTPVLGSGTVARITFTGVATGSSPLTITSDIWSDPDADPITHTKSSAVVYVYGMAAISGTVNLQGRATPLDALGTVTLTDPTNNFPPTVTNFGPSDGNFNVNVPALATGTSYTVTGAHALYLTNRYVGLNVTPGGSYSPTPATTRLRGGDATNDGTVELGDLTCVGGAFGNPPTLCGVNGSSDLNADGTTNILDLVLVGGNYNLSSPQPW
jgi:Tol biopolymer transport system component